MMQAMPDLIYVMTGSPIWEKTRACGCVFFGVGTPSLVLKGSQQENRCAMFVFGTGGPIPSPYAKVTSSTWARPAAP